MKFISLFLALFFSLLVTVPCSDTVSSYSNNSSASVEKDTENSQHSDFDACSIFCTCSCCGIVKVLDQKFAEITQIDSPEIYSKISDLQIFTLSKIPFGIWQPPKLS